MIVNGVVSYARERLRSRASADADRAVAASVGHSGDLALASDRRLARLSFGNGVLIGSAQILALLPGISRSGATMVGGLVRGLSHEDAARFSFLLATPVILAAGVLKLTDLTGPMGDGIRGQVLAGGVLSGIGAYLSVRFLTRYFETRTRTPLRHLLRTVRHGQSALPHARLTSRDHPVRRAVACALWRFGRPAGVRIGLQRSQLPG